MANLSENVTTSCDKFETITGGQNKKFIGVRVPENVLDSLSAYCSVNKKQKQDIVSKAVYEFLMKENYMGKILGPV